MQSYFQTAFLAVLLTAAVATGLVMNATVQAEEPAAKEAPRAVDAIAKPKLKPNIIFVVADDMGWQDTGFSGNQVVKTPHLDSMAASALWFDNFYSAHATCSPGRMAILTGRTPLRAKMVTTVGPMQDGEITVATALKTAGYETAHFGKWGLGREATHPTKVGFDEVIWSKGHYNNGVEFFVGDSDKRDEKPVKTEGESSIATVKLAIDFIQKRAMRKQPFFVQVSFGSPHGPHIPHEDFSKLYPDLQESDQNYYGEISGLDAAVGNLRQELRRLKIEDNTILWFVSDNGGIREGSGGKSKGQIGVRTTGLLEWPNKITKPMRTTIPVSHMDMYPTVLDIVGITLKHQPVIDGTSIVKLIEGKMKQRNKPIGFIRGGKVAPETPNICKTSDAVWIDGKYKLRLTQAKKNKPQRTTLHDIFADLTEQENLADQQPEKVQKMLNALALWRKSVQASYAGKDYKRNQK
tara:strand:- start:7742 stop:9136 length:1395 start_codon:yes stop_codon:yes gene_type:complete